MSDFRATFRVRRKRKTYRRWPLLALGSALSAVLALLSQQPPAKTNARIFNDGLKIKLSRTSPAFAALEDSLSSFDDTDAASPYLPISTLHAGEQSFEPLARQILSANAQVERQREEELRQLMHRAEEQATRLQATMRERTFKQGNQQVSQAQDAIARTPTSEQIAEARSVPQVVEREASEAQGEPVVHPPQVIHLAELKINREELLQGLFLPLMSAPPPQPSKHTRTAAATVKPTVPPIDPAGPPSALPPLPSTGPENGSETADAAAAESDDRPAAASTRGEGPRQVLIVGSLELREGLAFTSEQDQLLVYRDEEGQTMEAGHVWLREGRYEIFVERLKGNLIAELINSSGDIIGRGTFELADLSNTDRSRVRIDGVGLRILPVAHGLRGYVKSAYSRGTTIAAIEAAKVSSSAVDIKYTTKADGRFSDRRFVAGSSLIVHAQKAGYWGTLAFATTAYENSLTLYPDKMMEAFVNLVTDKPHGTPQTNASIVWGKVIRNGMPVAGAKVELLTGATEIKPVYFNSLMLPDANLSETSPNGMYAFFPVDPGVHAVQAQLGGIALEPVLFPTEEGYVSSMDLETNRAKKTEIRVFDAFKPQMSLAAKVTPVGGGDRSVVIDGSGQGALRYATGSAPLVLEADAGDTYSVTRISMSRDRRTIYFPMVQQDWLEALRNNRRITRDTDSGVVVGFVQASKSYRVYARVREKAETIRIVYFDPNGHALSGKTGVPGGGYAVFNVPEGFAALSVVSSGANTPQTVTVLVDKSVVNVINHSVR